MKFLIHTIPDRMWYVDRYILPRFKGSGATVDIYNDIHGDGNLISTMKSFLYYSDETKGSKKSTWHLQDDILLCHDFVERCSEVDDSYLVVCGTCYYLNKENLHKKTLKPHNMWWSFPCIRINDRIAYECARWFFDRGRFEKRFKMHIEAGRYDDLFFRTYLQEHYPRIDCLNMYPNLVDHVDCLLGGSRVGNDWQLKEGGGSRRAVGFEDDYLFDELVRSLKREGRL